MFRVGDKVVALKDTPYSITTKEAGVMTVVKVSNNRRFVDEDMIVTIDKHKSGEYFEVEARYFVRASGPYVVKKQFNGADIQ